MRTQTTSYADHVRTLIDAFDYEYCADCGADLDEHVIARDPIGLPHLYCTRED